MEETASARVRTAIEYPAFLQQFLEEGLHPDQVYDADESPRYWKNM